MKVAGIDFDWPKNIDVDPESGTLKLCTKAIGIDNENYFNMQNDDAAFEAWALYLYVSRLKTIKLDLQDDASEEISKIKDFPLLVHNHFNRFLYRVMNFKNQYGDWFKIDGKLASAVENFERALNEKPFCGNRPKGPASTAHTKREPQVEAAFADSEDGKCSPVGAKLLKNFMQEKHGITVAQIYRQLPAGLFLGSTPSHVTKSNRVFPGRSAAIDLWALSADKREIIIYELKAGGNRMAGIISELMFYANFIYDMYVEKKFQPMILAKKNYRGYKDLYDASQNGLTGVKAFMLTDDKPHDQFTDQVLAEMNASAPSRKIVYGTIRYRYKFGDGISSPIITEVTQG